MKFIKPILLLLILAGFSVAGLFIQQKSNNLTEKFSKVMGVKDFFTQKTEQFAPLSIEAQKQLEIVSERTQEIGEQSQQVLGETIKVNEAATSSDKPMYEKAFDYGRYVYCKQVVDDFEEK